MFCPCVDTAKPTLEEFQNSNNWNTVPALVPKLKRFLATKIHKLKKFFKSGSNSPAKKRSLEERQNEKNQIEYRQNRANEALERRLQEQSSYLEEEQNMVNENWENWDCCYLSAGQQPLYPSYEQPSKGHQTPKHSMCYVFLPGQAEPVPIRLRKAQIPGGAMYISYQPDYDLGFNLRVHTSSQIPQGQCAILV